MRQAFLKLCSIAVFTLVALGVRPSVALASAIYTFELPANGDVSALTIELTLPDLLPAFTGLQVFDLIDPEVTALSFTTPGFDPSEGAVGLEVTATETLVGVALFSPTDTILLTSDYPGDFFVFPRLPFATGTFASVAGNVSSDRTLDTATPVGSLTVTSVPEPITLSLLGMGLAAAGVRRYRRRA